MRARRLGLLAPFLLALLGRPAGSGAFAEAPAGFRLIIHPQSSSTSIDRALAAQVFLKKVRRWPDGVAIRPVDLDEASPVRQRWSGEVLKRSIESVKSYWQQMIFSGRDLPPPELDSDDEVVSYVLREPGSIGYVSSAANLRGAKVLTLR